ncbi:MAG: rod shape-determining protein MreD [Acidobacteriota bacterium]
MRVLRFLLALVAAFVVYVTLTRVFPSAARATDVFGLVLVYFAMSSGSAGGLLFGMAAGLVHDLASSSPLGLNGFAGTLAGYFVARVALQIESTQLSVVGVFFALGVAVEEAARALLVFLFVDAANPSDPLWVGARVLTSGALGLALVILRRRLSGRLERWRQMRRVRMRLGDSS